MNEAIVSSQSEHLANTPRFSNKSIRSSTVCFQRKANSITVTLNSAFSWWKVRTRPLARSWFQIVRNLSLHPDRKISQRPHANVRVLHFGSRNETVSYEEQMNDMGITKLSELKKATKKLGFPPNTAVMDVAMDPVPPFRCPQSNRTKPPIYRGGAKRHLARPWRVFVTPEEKLVITEAFSAAWRTDPVVQRSVKNEIRH